MGFYSVFTTEGYAIKWPKWFKEKYASSINFPAGEAGPLTAVRESKTYTVWASLEADIHAAIDWEAFKSKFIMVYLHECGGITRCQIEKDGIKWSEPIAWHATDWVEHDYCQGCSDAPAPRSATQEIEIARK